MSGRAFLLLMISFGVLALIFGVLLPSESRLDLYLKHGLGWAILSLGMLLICGIWSSCKVLVWATAARRRHLLFDAGLAVLVTWMVATLVPARSLIESDESAMQLTADAIRFTGGVATTISGLIDQSGMLHPTAVYLEKRGIMFPLMMVPLHGLGLRGLHAAWSVNLVALAIAFFSVARIARRFWPDPFPAVTLLLLASFPLLLVTARLGTYDAINLAVLLALLHCGASAVQTPAPWRVCLVGALAAVAVQLRYESALPASLVVAAILLRTLLTAGDRPRPLLIASLPLWIAPGLWRMAMSVDMELPTATTHAWSLEHAADNLPALVDWTLYGSAGIPGQPMVGWFAAFALLFMLIRRPVVNASVRLQVVSLVAPLLALLCVLMFSFWGQITYVVTGRYYLFYAALLAVFATAFLWFCRAQDESALGAVWNRRHPAVSCVIAAALLFHGVRRAGTSEDLLFPGADYRSGVVASVEHYYGACSVLVAGPFPGSILSRHLSAVHFVTWTWLRGGIEPYLQSIGIVAVVAPLAYLEGRPFTVNDHEAEVLSAPRVTEVRQGLLRIQLHELWRSPDGLTACSRRRPVSAISDTDLANAYRRPGHRTE